MLDAVAADAAQGYVDGDRPKDQAAARRMLVNDTALAVGLEALLIKGVDRPTLIASSADLLAADRRTAQAIVDDGKLLSKTSKDRAAVEDARKALAAGTAAWKNGLPTVAVASYGLAVEKAWDVLDTYKITYGSTVDRDKDGVPDVLELRAGADPRLSDTDGDGLSDSWEIANGMPYHMPGTADTDGDGSKDGLEDIDEDGLNAAGELRAGTKALEPDSDGDGLRDGPEVNTHKTNPLKADTDGDTLSDAAEIRGGTNPLKADSDDDGLRDDKETVTATAKRGDVKVELTGTGDLAGDFTIDPRPDDQLLNDAPGQVGEPIELTLAPEARSGFRSAKVTLGYDEAKAGGDEADLRVFTFDEERQFWGPVVGDADRRPGDQHGHGHGRPLLDLRRLQHQELEADVDRHRRLLRPARRHRRDRLPRHRARPGLLRVDGLERPAVLPPRRAARTSSTRCWPTTWPPSSTSTTGRARSRA